MGLTVEQRDEFARVLGVEPWTIPTADDLQASKPTPLQTDQLTSKDLSDDEFAILEPALPSEPRQRSAISNRTVIDALLWQHKTGKRMTQLPECYGTSEAVRKRSERWAVSGCWDALIAELDALGLPEARSKALRRIAENEARRGQRIRKKRRSG